MEYIFGFVLLLGVLVFIHEFGHFIVAKAFGMRVETFSIGMGKKIFSWKRGETEYALSLFPLGGYVKITGQDPREEVPANLDHRAFRNKPLYQRAAVVLAGPLFNAALAVLVFVALYNVGIPARLPVLERVLPDSPAFLSGFRTGDHVVEIRTDKGQTKEILELTDLEKFVGNHAGESLEFLVTRKIENPDGTTQEEKKLVRNTPVLGMERDSTIGVIQQRGIIQGVERNAPASVLIVNPATWAFERHLPSPFLVTRIEYGKEGSLTEIKTENWYDLEKSWQRIQQNSASYDRIIFHGHKVVLQKDPKAAESQEESKEESYTLAWTSPKDKMPKDLAAAGILSSELVVIEIVPNSPAEKLGLKAGDLVTQMNGKSVLSFSWFKEELQNLAAQNQAVKISWIRDGKTMESSVMPEMVSEQDPLTEVKKSRFQIGAAFLAIPAAPAQEVIRAKNFAHSVVLGFDRTYALTASMLSSFYHLAKGDISPKTLGGPLLIAKISGESFKQGYVAFLRMMAFISLNLFILNLLPIPVLDGGHLLLYTIEAIRRKPLSIKVVEVWTTAGFFLLMGLVAVVFFNDLSRLGLFKFFQS